MVSTVSILTILQTRSLWRFKCDFSILGRCCCSAPLCVCVCMCVCVCVCARACHASVWGDVQRNFWYESLACIFHERRKKVTRLIHMLHDSYMRDMTHSYETCLIHNASINVTNAMCLIRMLRDSFMYVMTHSYETWLNCVNPCYSTQTNAMCFFICCMTHSCVS